MIPNILSIAGSDPSGGAGIQADLKAIAAQGAYGMAALTALTAQNTQGVSGVHLVPPEFLSAQLEAVFADIRIDAVKTGMTATAALTEAVAQALEARPDVPLVVDPVMIAKGGARLLDPAAVAALRDRLVPRATVLTPNLPEAAALLSAPAARTRDEMEETARALLALGPRAVLLKGGHLEAEDSPDLLLGADIALWLEAPRRATRSTHGTGCTLSSALAAQIALTGGDLPEAARRAKAYVSRAIGAADRLSVGSGHGPLNHFP